MTLKAKQIEFAKEGMHADGEGLYLRVQASGAKSWIFRFQLNGKRREMGIGILDVKSPQEARSTAGKARDLVHAGIDPIEDRNRQAEYKKLAAAIAIMTFDEAAKQYIAAHKGGWKNAKHADQWQNTLDTYASPEFGKLPVAAVDLAKIRAVLDPIWPTKTETASRLRGRIEKVLDWSIVQKYREGPNPARWKGHLEHLMASRRDMAGAGNKAATVRHHPALPYKDMATFMVELRALPGTGAKALEFGILTAARSGEVRGALWAEINFDECKWVIPKERMKAKRDHEVPLSTAAIALLTGIDRSAKHALVFVGERGSKVSERGAKPISDMTISAVIRRMNEAQPTAKWVDPTNGAEIVPHGFRSTFRDWAAEETEFPNEMVEMALAHAVGNKVEAAYRRGNMYEKRRKLMDAWASWCDPKPQADAQNTV